MDREKVITAYIETRNIESAAKKEMLTKCVYADIAEDVIDYILMFPPEIGKIIYSIYIGSTEEWFFITKIVYERTKDNEMSSVYLDLIREIACVRLHPPDEYMMYIESHKELAYFEICSIRNKIEQQKYNGIFKALSELKKCLEVLQDEGEKEKLKEENKELKEQVKSLTDRLSASENDSHKKKKGLLKRPRDEEMLIMLMIERGLGKNDINAVNEAIKSKIPYESLIRLIESVGKSDGIPNDALCDYIYTLINLKER